MEEIARVERKITITSRRKVLIKLIIQAIPSFALSCFKIPIGLCNEIEVLIRKF